MSLQSYGQKVKFSLYNTDNGLSGNNTSALTQDDRGFLWFINEGKLHRYDGKNFLAIKPDPKILELNELFLGIHNFNDSLLVIWSEHLAFLYNPLQNSWKKLPDYAKNALGPDETFVAHRMGVNKQLINRAVRNQNTARILYCTAEGLAPLSLPTRLQTLGNFNEANGGYFLNYWCDIAADGLTYLAYQDTLYQIDQNGHQVHATSMSNIGQNCYNLCFKFTADGTVVLLANWKFYTLNRNSNQFEAHPANRFLDKQKAYLHRFIISETDDIWACGPDRNFVHYIADNDTLINYRAHLEAVMPNPNDLKDLFKDASGVIWVETRLGLFKVLPQPLPFENYFSHLSGNKAYFSFRGITQDSSGTLYGMYYNGIARFNKVSQKTFDFNHVDLFDLCADKKKVWVNGSYYFDPVTTQLKQAEGNVPKSGIGDNGFFAQDAQGKLWWAAHYQLFGLNKTGTSEQWELELEIPDHPLNKTGALYYGPFSGFLWMGVAGKLLCYNPATKAQQWLNISELNPSITRINAINELNKDALWLGTDAGLVHFNWQQGEAMLFTTKEGLPNNFVCGLLNEGDSALWASTNHGLSRFEIKKNAFLNFFEDDGLTHNEFNRKSYFKSANGKMYFGGMRGINAFFPNQIMKSYRNKSKKANLVLSSFEYEDERTDSVITNYTFSRNPIINLYHWDWSFVFEYVLTDYSNPDEIFYSYKMDGYKETWSVPSKLNSARFNSLPIGEYTFRVKARDSRGRWHPNELSVKIVVHPPWWLTKTAYLFYILTFLFLLRVFSKFRERRLVNRQRELEQTVSIRTAELTSQKQEVERQKMRSDELLLNILPAEVAEELKLTGRAEARLYEGTSVMFTDFADFTLFAENLSAAELVHEIDACFQGFDLIISKYKLEKIKTIGDAYMCAGGLNNLGQGGPTAVVLAALEMQEFMQKRRTNQAQIGKPSFAMRVGIHTGPVVAGVVGVNKFQYDIWGDTVNTANRIESSGEVGRVNISQCTYDKIKDDLQFTFESRGEIEVKGKGPIEMWFVSKFNQPEN